MMMEETTWTEGPPIPYSISGASCAVAVDPTTIIITGGFPDSLTKVARLDVTTGVWSSLPDLPRNRSHHGCAVVTNSGGDRFLVVAGGETTGRRYNNSTDILDLASVEWSTGGEMNEARCLFLIFLGEPLSLRAIYCS